MKSESLDQKLREECMRSVADQSTHLTPQHRPLIEQVVGAGGTTEGYLYGGFTTSVGLRAILRLTGKSMYDFNGDCHSSAGLYGVAGSSGKGGNFVETMLKKAAQGVPIKVVSDQVLTPTFTADLAETACRLIQMKAFGLYHVTAEGQCSWYEFARTIFELEKLTVDLTPGSTAEFPSPVQRPSYSVLSKQKLNGLGLAMPPWQEGHVRYLRARWLKRQPSTTSA